MNKNQYIFKYNKQGELYLYVELNKHGKILSYFELQDKKLIRFDKTSHLKQMIVFKNKVLLKQKFMSGESFISVFDAQNDDCVYHNMPEKEREIKLIKNNISISDFGKFVIERWKKIQNEEMIQKTETNSIKTTLHTFNSISKSLTPILRQGLK